MGCTEYAESTPRHSPGRAVFGLPNALHPEFPITRTPPAENRKKRLTDAKVWRIYLWAKRSGHA
jgi:hypothetical protein